MGRVSVQPRSGLATGNRLSLRASQQPSGHVGHCSPGLRPAASGALPPARSAEPPSASRGRCGRGHLCLRVLAVAIIIAAWAVGGCGAQPTPAQLGVTAAELQCFNAIAFDLCLTDSSFACETRFYLDQFSDPTYQQQLFYYLVDVYAFDSNFSVLWMLSQMGSPGDPFITAVDTAYGSNCGGDSGVQTNWATTTLMEGMTGRTFVTYVLGQADFCEANEIFVLGMNCTCKDDGKICDTDEDSSGSPRNFILLALVVLALNAYTAFVLSRHSQGHAKEYRTLINAVSGVSRVMNKWATPQARAATLDRAAHTPTTPPLSASGLRTRAAQRPTTAPPSAPLQISQPAAPIAPPQLQPVVTPPPPPPPPSEFGSK